MKSRGITAHLPRSLPRYAPSRSFVHLLPSRYNHLHLSHPLQFSSSSGGLFPFKNYTRKMTSSAMQSVQVPTKAATATFQLTKTEEALAVLLHDACQWIQENQPQPDTFESAGLQVQYAEGWTLEARIAGGWVRDKLLGLESHDLDISLSTLTGHTFALLLRSYLLSTAFKASEIANDPTSPFHSSSASSDHLVGHITRIAANPEQSKNLETATAKVAGLQLDFVNLRKEVYLGDSRIPTMTFGTAQEDAERRDITINTLFYNIHTRQVEDFTGLGLSDMKDRIIRTPLSPQTTFLDDPLRVLRCVRFASRFGYTVHEDIMTCFHGKHGDQIREALRYKVSRERFGIEVDKMMRGPDPLGALQLIFDLGLFEVIFFPTPDSNLRGRPMESPQKITMYAAGLLDGLWKEAQKRQNGHPPSPIWQDIHDSLLAPLLDEEKRRLLFYAVAFLPLREVEWEEVRGKGNWLWAGEGVVFNGLKLGVANTKKPLSDMMKAITILENPTPEAFEVRSPDYRGVHIPSYGGWPLSSRATIAIQDASRNSFDNDRKPAVLFRPYLSFYSSLASTGLLHQIQDNVLLNGKEVQDVLQIKPQGPSFSMIMKRVEAWQFDQDFIDTNLEDQKRACKEWLLDEWNKGSILPKQEEKRETKSKKKSKIAKETS